jgi:hypothetical protein
MLVFFVFFHYYYIFFIISLSLIHSIAIYRLQVTSFFNASGSGNRVRLGYRLHVYDSLYKSAHAICYCTTGVYIYEWVYESVYTNLNTKFIQ